jgi:hypothetical protein
MIVAAGLLYSETKWQFFFENLPTPFLIKIGLAKREQSRTLQT